MRKSKFTESQIIKAIKANENGQRVEDLCRARVLNQLEEEIGLPKVIRVDNGPEFISKEFTDWCERRAIEIRYIGPGKPM